MKRNIKIRIASLILAVIVLGGAVTAAALIGSPYDILKNAVIEALTEDSFTLEGELSVIHNGELVYNVGLKHIQGNNRSLSHERQFSIDGYPFDGFVFNTPYVSINRVGHRLSPTDWYMADMFRPTTTGNASGPFNAAVNLSPLTNDMVNSPEFRFAEMALDILVGDLRNNFSISAIDGGRAIRGSFSHAQIPEIVQLGMDVLAANMNRHSFTQNRWLRDDKTAVYHESIFVDFSTNLVTHVVHMTPIRVLTDEEFSVSADGQIDLSRVISGEIRDIDVVDGTFFTSTGYSQPHSRTELPLIPENLEGINPLMGPIRDFRVNLINLDATINENTQLKTLEARAFFTFTDAFGQMHEVEIHVDLSYTDIGTSNPVSPILNAEAVFTPALMTAMGFDSRLTLYFQLNEDGTINESTFTTEHPLNNTARVAAREALGG